MSCFKCGQADIADGGIGCVCGKCKRCNGLSAGKSGYCFLCRPCTVCGRSIEMHVGCKPCEPWDDNDELHKDEPRIVRSKHWWSNGTPSKGQ